MMLARSLARGVTAAPAWRRTQLRWASEEAKAEEKAAEAKEEASAEGEKGEEAPCPKEAKIQELSKQVAYSLAEAENARKIALRDVDNARQYALKSFAKELLEVVDNMDRAIQATPKDKLEADPTLASLFKGVEMTQHSLMRALERNGVKSQNVQVGDEFDPNLHEALFNIPATGDQKPGTIGNVVKNGFNYNSRVLRASQVGVFQEQ